MFSITKDVSIEITVAIVDGTFDVRYEITLSEATEDQADIKDAIADIAASAIADYLEPQLKDIALAANAAIEAKLKDAGHSCTIEESEENA